MEKEIELQQEAVKIYKGGGAVNSVNGQTGDVVLTTSDLQNTSDYQTGSEVDAAISAAIADKQDALTAGNNIQISEANVISATDTTYTAGNGLSLTGTAFSVDTNTIATKQSVTDEATARENADIGLQGQIDALSAASDVTDVVGTYTALQAYDTSKLKDNDIIKVLQDENQNNETTYYRWSTSTETFTLIGEEGPYYTRSATDQLLQAKQDTLTAGNNITILNNVISASGGVTELTQADYNADNTDWSSVDPSTYNCIALWKLDNGYYHINYSSPVPIVYINPTTMGSAANGTDIIVNKDGVTNRAVIFFFGNTGGPAFTVVNTSANTTATDYVRCLNLNDMQQSTGTSTYFPMSQNATTSMVYADPSTRNKVQIGNGSMSSGTYAVAVGPDCYSQADRSVAIGTSSNAALRGSIALGAYSRPFAQGEMNIGSSNTSYGYNSSNYRLLTGLYDGQNAHDAATVGQINATIDAINTALSTSIPHIGA